MLKTRYGSQTFKQQIQFFREKENIPTRTWNAIWKQAHDQAFVVAGAMKTDMLADFREAVDSAIANGKSLGWFKKEFNNIRTRYGWEHTGSASWRSRIIYKTNMVQSYNAGRWEQLQQFEYWEYRHGGSLDPRIVHLGWDSMLLPKADAFWLTHFPQNGWGCSCKVIGRTSRYIQSKGLSVSESPTVEYVNWVDKTTGEVHNVPHGIDPGFDYAPGGNNSPAKVAKRYADAKPALKDRLPERLIPTAYSSIKQVNIDTLNQALTQIGTPEVNALSRFVTQRNIKTVFLQSSEMTTGTKAQEHVEAIGEYLEQTPDTRLFIPNRSGVEGFTRADMDHVVISSRKSHNLKKIDVQALKAQYSVMILDGINKTGPHAFEYDGQSVNAHFSFIEAAGSMTNEGSRLLTWLHEIGHQVHYKAGVPSPPVSDSLVFYGYTSEREWFAEHFTAYILDRQTLANWHPDVVQWFDNVLKQASGQ